MTDNIFKAVLLGAGVTAVIQSSSATTVMVVGFVNSGIMKLSQAVGVIMGANIGTTVTSWLLSLTGIQGDNFILTLMKPSSFSPILAVIGIGFLMFSKNEKKKDIGTIMIGFTVLMFGMETMSDAVKPLADVPEFANILLMFKNPLLGMLAGLVLTAVIQSSSASVGILQSLCVTGAVSYGAAIPIIMGQNIGTCVTALLSSIGASKNAKRTAFVHLYFNIIGTMIFMIGFSAHGLLILLIRHNIADISNSLDHRTGLTEFFTQGLDMHIQSSRFTLKINAPDTLHDRISRSHNPCIGHQKFQQLIFLIGQLTDLITDIYGMLFIIHKYIAQRQEFLFFHISTSSQQCLDS